MSTYDDIVSILNEENIPASAQFAMLANWYAESGLDSEVHEGHTGGGLWDSGGYGLAQWTSSDRKAGLQAFADSLGTDVSDLRTQVLYSLNEIDPNLLTKISNESNEDAAKDYMIQYEAPQDQSDNAVYNRIQAFKDYLKDPTPTNLTHSSNSSTGGIMNTIQKDITRVLKILAGFVLFAVGIYMMIATAPKKVINERGD